MYTIALLNLDAVSSMIPSRKADMRDLIVLASVAIASSCDLSVKQTSQRACSIVGNLSFCVAWSDTLVAQRNVYNTYVECAES